jgi:superfamily II DNA helicase RecQ
MSRSFLVHFLTHFASDYAYRDFENLKRMFEKEMREGRSDRESLKRQEDDARVMVAYCQNESDCRRVQLLQFFGEKFNQKLCRNGCDNCRNPDRLQEGDFTKQATQVIDLIRSLGSQNVSSDQCRQILKGSNCQAVRDKRHDRLPLFGACKDLTPELLELLVNKMLFQDILKFETTQNNAGWNTQYLKVV